jgi:hypothetical protein
MKSLEDYLICLLTGLISLNSLRVFHEKAVSLGILKEDQECRANTLVWDFIRLKKLYQDQAESVLELLPSDLKLEDLMRNVALNEISVQQKLRKPRKKKCAT